jgi:sugar phosphate isomerase/epimerase
MNREVEMKHSVFTVLLPDKNSEEVFQLLKELNYDGVELRVKEDYHISPAEILSSVKRLQELMSQYKLEIPVLATYLSIRESKALLPIFEAADILGAKGVRVSLGPPLDIKQSYWSALDETKKELEHFIKAIQPFKAKALFEIHFKTLISSPSLAYLLLKSFDPGKIGIIYDPGNMIVEGKEDWKVGVEVIKDYLWHVHVKNISWRKEEKWNWSSDELECGMVNWEEVMMALLSINYTGYISNENLCGVNLPRATGFIGEQLPSSDSTSQKPIREKLIEDLRYLKELERKVSLAK